MKFSLKNGLRNLSFILIATLSLLGLVHAFHDFTLHDLKIIGPVYLLNFLVGAFKKSPPVSDGASK